MPRAQYPLAVSSLFVDIAIPDYGLRLLGVRLGELDGYGREHL